MITSRVSKLLGCIAALAVPFVSAAQTAPVDSSKLWCFAGGIYDGATNTGQSSITVTTERRTACVSYFTTITYSCVGVAAGSVNQSGFQYSIQRCIPV